MSLYPNLRINTQFSNMLLLKHIWELTSCPSLCIPILSNQPPHIFYVTLSYTDSGLLVQTVWMHSTVVICPLGLPLQCARMCMCFGLCGSEIKATIFSSSALLQALIWNLNVGPSVLPWLCPCRPNSMSRLFFFLKDNLSSLSQPDPTWKKK